MKLATLATPHRDGALLVVRRDLQRFAHANHITPTLQAALDSWSTCEPQLQALAAALEAGTIEGEVLDQSKLHSPLPRAYEWIDGSAFLNHVILVRKARNAEPPETLRTDPLIYQGGSGTMLRPTEDIALSDTSWGLDFESEVAVILGDTPQGTTAAEAHKHVRLVMLVNDITLRNLIPAELAKGFGFFQSKPSSTFSPIAVTPDELGDSWRDGRLHLSVKTSLNNTLVGDTDAGEMHFSFYQLIEHICRTRSYTAGTILGSGTVSNEDRSRGISCLAEQRMIEIIEQGKPITPFMKPGDHVRIELFNQAGENVFGTISQKVVTR
jgi:fumarylacetoacetate (FAA) hydrolase